MQADDLRRAEIKFIRDNLVHQYGSGALHVAELAQSGALDYILSLVTTARIHVPPTMNLDIVLGSFDRFSLFVKDTDDVRRVAAEADAKALGSAPFVFIIFGMRGAKDKATTVYRSIIASMTERGYSLSELADDRQAVGVFYRT